MASKKPAARIECRDTDTTFKPTVQSGTWCPGCGAFRLAGSSRWRLTEITKFEILLRGGDCTHRAGK